MNRGFTYREQIGGGAAGRALVDHLASRYRHSTADTWRARIASGQVSLDARPAVPQDVLVAGQELAWARPPWEEPAVPLAFAVLHRDEALLAVAKPRGLPTVPAGGFLEHTLLHLVQRVHPRAAPLHRLGRGTSGLVLFALTDGARATVAAAWRAGAVEKTYRALVAGVPEAEEFRVDVPIGPVPHPRLGTVHAASPSGRRALSLVRVVARGTGRALVEVRIPTGRPHQIRIHLAAAGHPLVGDPLYGAGGQPLLDPALPGEGGYLLHAHRLGLAHPVHGGPLALCCPLPRGDCVAESLL